MLERVDGVGDVAWHVGSALDLLGTHVGAFLLSAPYVEWSGFASALETGPEENRL
jgi:hypothetical protein